MFKNLDHVHWTGRYKMSDEPDPDNPWDCLIRDRKRVFPFKVPITIPYLEIEIGYFLDDQTINNFWTKLEGNEHLRGIVPDEFIDTGKIVYG